MSKEYERKAWLRGADDHTEKRFPRERRAEERVPMRERDAEADGLIEGRNAVTEALRAGTPIDKIFIARGETDKTLGHIASTARAAGVVVVEADRRKLDYMSATKAHQGVIALAAVREYASVEDILSAARERGEASARGVRRDQRPAQPRRHHPHGGVRGRARRHHPQAPQRGLDEHRRQDERGRGERSARRARAEHSGAFEGAAAAGRVDLRHRRRGDHEPVRGRPQPALPPSSSAARAMAWAGSCARAATSSSASR